MKAAPICWDYGLVLRTDGPCAGYPLPVPDQIFGSARRWVLPEELNQIRFIHRVHNSVGGIGRSSTIREGHKSGEHEQEQGKRS